MRTIKSLVTTVGTTTLLACSCWVLAQEPDVTERQEDDRTIREYRYQGQLYAIEILPEEGGAYTLVDHEGDGDFERETNGSTEIPQWLQEDD
ncbi:DUF2782 domain-containing protein [Aidingimonas halophila]|uniref:DUF2782 domain-containing protein n=1 Tax=Aidingimonas halophila TaxID=574349 RepID=A0A1H2Z427_9GAMM|nr:DUF2782 domain-containing protein [Aidingimonas halophila]GHC15271.1 hypothetical protein GCM10008094_00220 [Aidingimonas halophila]SDX11758.1 Protein of unknown function [Aidingimonas halophila]